MSQASTKSGLLTKALSCATLSHLIVSSVFGNTFLHLIFPFILLINRSSQLSDLTLAVHSTAVLFVDFFRKRFWNDHSICQWVCFGFLPKYWYYLLTFTTIHSWVSTPLELWLMIFSAQIPLFVAFFFLFVPSFCFFSLPLWTSDYFFPSLI